MLRWSIFPEHIPWENRGYGHLFRDTPIENTKGIGAFAARAFSTIALLPTFIHHHQPLPCK
jgi:hypothetical protein